MTEQPRHAPGAGQTTDILASEFASEFRAALGEMQKVLHDAAGREIADAQQKAQMAKTTGTGQAPASPAGATLQSSTQQTAIQDALKREEEAVSLQRLLGPMFRQAEAALQALEQHRGYSIPGRS